MITTRKGCCLCLWINFKFIVSLPFLIVYGLFLFLLHIFITIPCRFKFTFLQKILFHTLGCIFGNPRRVLRLVHCLVCSDNMVSFEKCEEKTVYLTLDDAPSADPDLMHELLDVLQKYDVKASFFVIASFAENNRDGMEILQRAVDEGHYLCNHWGEDVPQWCSVFWGSCCCGCDCSYTKLRSGINRTNHLIKSLDPENDLAFFRLPAGLGSRSICKIIEGEYNFTNILGDLFTGDPVINDADFHISWGKKYTQPGSVFIFHCPEYARQREQTISIIDELIPYLQNEGYEFKRLDEGSFTQYQKGSPMNTPFDSPTITSNSESTSITVHVSGSHIYENHKAVE